MFYLIAISFHSMANYLFAQAFSEREYALLLSGVWIGALLLIIGLLYVSVIRDYVRRQNGIIDRESSSDDKPYQGTPSSRRRKPVMEFYQEMGNPVG